MFATSTNTVAMFVGTVVTATAADSVVHTVQSVFSGSSSVLYVDSTSTGSLNPGSGGFTSNALSLGPAQADVFTGNIMEVGYYPIGFNGTQNANLHANQCAYWGTTC